MNTMQSKVVTDVPNFRLPAAPFLHALMRGKMREVHNAKFAWLEAEEERWNWCEIVRTPFDPTIPGNTEFHADGHAESIETILFRGRRRSMPRNRYEQTHTGGVEWFLRPEEDWPAPIGWGDLMTAVLDSPCWRYGRSGYAFGDLAGKHLFVARAPHAPTRNHVSAKGTVLVAQCQSLSRSVESRAYLIDMKEARLAYHVGRMWGLHHDGVVGVSEYLSDVGFMLTNPEAHDVFSIKTS